MGIFVPKNLLANFNCLWFGSIALSTWTNKR